MRLIMWLDDIPVEAVCRVCPAVSFKVRNSSHQPNREEYQKSLQVQFDAPDKAVHAQQ
jgi:hypothetical protein